MVELTQAPPQQIESSPCVLLVNDAVNKVGSGAGIVLEGPDGVVVEQSLKFNFSLTHNQVKYKALLVGMRLTQEVGVQELVAKGDSKLVML